MTEFNTPVVRARVWHDGHMYTPEEATQARFVLLPTGNVGRVDRRIERGSDAVSLAEAPRLDIFDSDRAFSMLSTLAHDANGCEVFVGDVIEELQYGRRYVVQHGCAFVSEMSSVGFFGAPLGKLERRMLRISDDLSHYRILGTMYDEDFDTVKASTQ